MISKSDKPLIKSFVDNKPLMEAVRRVLTQKIYEHGTVNNPNKNFVFSLKLEQSDEEYGRKAKLIVQSLIVVEEAFNDMTSQAASDETPAEQVNEAR